MSCEFRLNRALLETFTRYCEKVVYSQTTVNGFVKFRWKNSNLSRAPLWMRLQIANADYQYSKFKRMHLRESSFFWMDHIFSSREDIDIRLLFAKNISHEGHRVGFKLKTSLQWENVQFRRYIRDFNVTTILWYLPNIFVGFFLKRLNFAFYLFSQCFLGFFQTLHQRAYDQNDRDFLAEVVDILKGTRVRLKSHLARHTGLSLQFVRLISTGHICSGSGWNVGARAGCPTQPTPPSAPVNRGHSFSGSLLGRSSSALAGTTVGCMDNHLFHAGGCRMVAISPVDICDAGAFTAPSDLQISAVLAMGPIKLEEIDRLTGGKERLCPAPTSSDRRVQGLGVFIMGIMFLTSAIQNNANQWLCCSYACCYTWAIKLSVRYWI